MHVAIIGGGAAGCVLALRLARRGVNVTLLESGPRYSERDILDRFSRHEEGRAGVGNPFPLKDRTIEAFHNAGTIRMPLGYERVRALGVSGAGGGGWGDLDPAHAGLGGIPAGRLAVPRGRSAACLPRAIAC